MQFCSLENATVNFGFVAFPVPRPHWYLPVSDTHTIFSPMKLPAPHLWQGCQVRRWPNFGRKVAEDQLEAPGPKPVATSAGIHVPWEARAPFSGRGSERQGAGPQVSPAAALPHAAASPTHPRPEGGRGLCAAPSLLPPELRRPSPDAPPSSSLVSFLTKKCCWEFPEGPGCEVTAVRSPSLVPGIWILWGRKESAEKQRSWGSEWSRGCCRRGRLAPLSPALVSSWVFWPQAMFQGKRCFTSPVVKKWQLKQYTDPKGVFIHCWGWEAGVEGRERSGEQPGNRIRILNENVLRPNSWAYSSSVTYWLTLEIVQYHFFHSLLKTGH